MTNHEFIQKLISAAQDYKTVYANGMFGHLVTEEIISQKTQQLPGWYTASRQAELRALTGKEYFGFDCICLVKGILWGWSGDASKKYGGAVYQSNSVPDVTEGQMLNNCTAVSSDFTDLIPGEYLWIQGHCGVYIGDGLAVECTPKWENGVQITAVGNLGDQKGYYSRTWSKHGKLPYVDYIEASQAESSPAPAGKTVTVELLTLRRGENRGSAQIGTVQTILKGKGSYTMDIDNSYGPGTETAVKNFQGAKGLAADGIVGIDTWTALLKE